jgi:hypothetical protein
MQTIRIEVCIKKSDPIELIVPIGITARELHKKMIVIYQIENTEIKKVQLEPHGRLISLDTSLEEEAVTTGAKLTFF